jgi:hypothetical protein
MIGATVQWKRLNKHLRQDMQVENYSLWMDGLGQLIRIPEDFKFSMMSNTYSNCWVQRNVGNQAHTSIPPLQVLIDPCEFNFSNQKEKTDQEKHSLRENLKNRR